MEPHQKIVLGLTLGLIFLGVSAVVLVTLLATGAGVCPP
jgi:hypothetical protein